MITFQFAMEQTRSPFYGWLPCTHERSDCIIIRLLPNTCIPCMAPYPYCCIKYVPLIKKEKQIFLQSNFDSEGKPIYTTFLVHHLRALKYKFPLNLQVNHTNCSGCYLSRKYFYKRKKGKYDYLYIPNSIIRELTD